MGQKKGARGLYQRKGVWHIDKQYRGHRICKSTGATEKKEAEALLAHEVVKLRRHLLFGEPEEFNFEDAAIRYAKEETKKSLDRDLQDLSMVMPFIGGLSLRQVHMGTLQSFIAKRKREGVKSSTVNRTLTVVKLVLKRASGRYRDSSGHPWLVSVPEIPRLHWNDARKPYPISDLEEKTLLASLDKDLKEIAIFLLHTGLRSRELCALEWTWENTENDRTCFVIPGEVTKNSQDRLVVCNSIARDIIDRRRGNISRWIFPTKEGKKRSDIRGTGWRNARRRAAVDLEARLGKTVTEGFRSLRVHDLRHTFGQRLRRLGVAHETRKDLMGHKNGDITTLYSEVEVEELYLALNKLCIPPRSTQILSFPANLPQTREM